MAKVPKIIPPLKADLDDLTASMFAPDAARKHFQVSFWKIVGGGHDVYATASDIYVTKTRAEALMEAEKKYAPILGDFSQYEIVALEIDPKHPPHVEVRK